MYQLKTDTTKILPNNKQIFYQINPKNLLGYLKEIQQNLENFSTNLKKQYR